MRIPRVYLPETLQTGARFTLPEVSRQHLLRVLRLKTGNRLQVFDGQGNEYQAMLLDDKIGIIEILEDIPNPIQESPLTIQLGQGISRGEKMDFTLQKAVELGVNVITPLFTVYSGVTLTAERLEKRMEHWQGVIQHACEQCGRAVMPELRPAMQLSQWLTNLQAELKLVLAPTGSHHLKQLSAAASVALLVGSEGGLHADEIQLAIRHQFVDVQLGPRILRTETAALAAVSALQTLWGDF
ncbi:MAG: 16S rRNA (uracil(1498)-N(3))-methyltransferase [Gammaproteobacteria bacterium]